MSSWVKVLCLDKRLRNGRERQALRWSPQALPSSQQHSPTTHSHSSPYKDSFIPSSFPPSGVTHTTPTNIVGPKHHQFSSGQLFSCVQLFATPWTAACQASLYITYSWSLLKLMSIKSVMPSNHLLLCCPLIVLLSNLS